MHSRLTRLFAALAACLLVAGLWAPAALAAGESRVYDEAGLFDAQQAERLNERALALADELDLDFVIVTTNDTLGKSTTAYADDFYDDNGFGVGASYDGMLLLIDMQHREVYISTHALALDYFSDADIERVLDDVFEYMPDADYAGAAFAFLEAASAHVRACRAQDKAAGGAPPDVLDPAQKVYDYAGLLSSSERQNLREYAQRTIQRTGLDVGMVFVRSTGGKSMMALADDLYDYSGFGVGDGSDGLLLLVRIGDDGSWDVRVSAHGRANTLWSDASMDAMLDTVADYVDKGSYADAADAFLLDVNLKGKGYASGSNIDWANILSISLGWGGIAGLITAVILLIMHHDSVPKTANANAYLVPGSTVLTHKADVFINTNVSKRPRPQQTSSGYGGHSGGFGGSTYTSSSGRSHSGGSRSSGTSSHRSSGGRSHGGGGRKF